MPSEQLIGNLTRDFASLSINEESDTDSLYDFKNIEQNNSDIEEDTHENKHSELNSDMEEDIQEDRYDEFSDTDDDTYYDTDGEAHYDSDGKSHCSSEEEDLKDIIAWSQGSLEEESIKNYSVKKIEVPEEQEPIKIDSEKEK